MNNKIPILAVTLPYFGWSRTPAPIRFTNGGTFFWNMWGRKGEEHGRLQDQPKYRRFLNLNVCKVLIVNSNCFFWSPDLEIQIVMEKSFCGHFRSIFENLRQKSVKNCDNYVPNVPCKIQTFSNQIRIRNLSRWGISRWEQWIMEKRWDFTIQPTMWPHHLVV